MPTNPTSHRIIMTASKVKVAQLACEHVYDRDAPQDAYDIAMLLEAIYEEFIDLSQDVIDMEQQQAAA